MKKNNILLLTVFILTLLFSCKKNKDEAPQPQDQNEQELITSVSLIIKESGTLVDTFSFRDPDGIGGNPPTIEDIVLAANKTYTCSLLLLDETKTPADTVSKEIEAERDLHEFFFHPSAGTNLTISYDDFDDHGVPVGLETTFVTGAASSGTLEIVLKHQPDVKPTSGNGNESLGETDVQVQFNLSIQ